MATFEIDHTCDFGEAAREWQRPNIALYAAGVVAGAALGVGIVAFGAGGSADLSLRTSEELIARPAISEAAPPARPAPSFRLSPVAGGAFAVSEVFPFAPAWTEPVTTPADDAAWVAPAAPEAPAGAPSATLPTATGVAPGAPAPAAAPIAPAPAAAPAAPAAPPANTAPAAPPQSLPQVPPAKPNFYVPAVSSAPMTDLERRFLDGVNAERVAAGLTPYTLDSGLSVIARTRSQQMVDQDYFGHKDPYGYSMYVELLAHFGYTSYAWAGENLALNNYGDAESPERAVALLMTSPTHKANILDTEFTRVGVGEVTHADGRRVYAMIFLS
jgi:uncharacterized protein YkwD